MLFDSPRILRFSFSSLFNVFLLSVFFFSSMFSALLAITKKPMILSKTPPKYARLLNSSVHCEKKHTSFSLCIVALYVTTFWTMSLATRNSCATFLRPPCYVNLWQHFTFCCSFNGFEWFLIFFNRIPFLKSLSPSLYTHAYTYSQHSQLKDSLK